MTARLRWWDEDTHNHGVDAVLVPCTFEDPAEREAEWWGGVSVGRSVPVPSSFGLPAHPGTLAPERGEVVLRIGYYAWWTWLLLQSHNPGVGTGLDAEDETTGGLWTVTMTSWNPPGEGTSFAAAARPCSIQLPQDRALLDEAAPLIWKRYEHLDPRPLSQR